MRRLFPLFLLLLTTAGLRAGLTFDVNPLELHPKAEAEEVEATFTFRNTSDKPIRVLDIESSCSCLEATIDKAIYAPGEKGTGKAVFKISSFVGRHEKSLHLHTDDTTEPDKVLKTVIDIPIVIEVEPRMLQWVLDEEPVAKEFTIKMVGPDPINITSVTTTREIMTFETKEITPGREYRIAVKPSTTADIAIGALKITTDSPIHKYSRQMAFYNIVRPEVAAKKAAAEAAKQK